MANVNILITAENAQAIAGLQQAENSVKKLGQSAQVASAAGLKELQKSTVGIANGFRAMQGTMVMLGGQQFPKLMLGVLAVQQSMTGLRAVAEATRLSMMTLGSTAAVGIASVTAVVAAGVTWWQKYNAELAEYRSRGELADQSTGLRIRLLKELRDAAKFLSPEANAGLTAILAGAEGMSTAELAKATRPYFVSEDQKKAVRELSTLQATLLADSLEGFEKEREAAAQEYRERRHQIDDLRKAAGNTADYTNTIGPAYEFARQAYENRLAAIDTKEAAEKKAAAEKEAADQAKREMEYHQRISQMIDEEVAAQEQQRMNAISSAQSDWRLTDQQKYDRLSGLGVSGSELGPNPGSFAEQWKAATIQIQNAFGSLAQTLTSGAFNMIQMGVSGISDALTGIILGTKTAGQAFAQFGLQMLTSFISMVVNALIWAYLAIPVLTALGVLSGGATASAGAPITIAAVAGAMGSVGGMVGARERGGPVSGGGLYLTGERGPELFVPDTAGSILTASQTSAVLGRSSASGRSGAQTIHNYIDRQAFLNSIRDDIEGTAVRAVIRNQHLFT